MGRGSSRTKWTNYVVVAKKWIRLSTLALLDFFLLSDHIPMWASNVESVKCRNIKQLSWFCPILMLSWIWIIISQFWIIMSQCESFLVIWIIMSKIASIWVNLPNFVANESFQDNLIHYDSIWIISRQFDLSQVNLNHYASIWITIL